MLTERGGIFRAGSAHPDGEEAQLGNDAADLRDVLGVPFGGAVPRARGLPEEGASIAEGFVVVRSGDPFAPAGFVVLDSQGGHFQYDGNGNASADAAAGSVLNPDVAYPFFPGLDIARDIELPPAAGNATATNDPTHGLAIYDGWGGVHPVPVTATENSRVAFLRNEGLTTVGLPYIQTGFDDPSTPMDEGDPFAVGIDVGSIFIDIEFCATGSEGVYVLDGFGAVFAFGSTRSMPESPATKFSGGPYFFPNRYARDLEAAPAFTGPPEIEFTYVPLGNDSNRYVSGVVRNVDPSQYRVALYLSIPRVTRSFSILVGQLATIRPDGTWNVQMGGGASSGNYIRAFLLPEGVNPPRQLGYPDYPGVPGVVASVGHSYLVYK